MLYRSLCSVDHRQGYSNRAARTIARRSTAVSPDSNLDSPKMMGCRCEAFASELIIQVYNLKLVAIGNFGTGNP